MRERACSNGSQRRGRKAVALAALVLAGGLILPVVEFVRLHPYEYTYFNHIAGGVAGADGRYMRDYWGLSFKQAGEALRANFEGAARRRLRPPHGRSRYAGRIRRRRGARPRLRAHLGSARAPIFALMLGEFYCAELDAPLLAEISRGRRLRAAYDLRGRDREPVHVPPVQWPISKAPWVGRARRARHEGNRGARCPRGAEVPSRCPPYETLVRLNHANSQYSSRALR